MAATAAATAAAADPKLNYELPQILFSSFLAGVVTLVLFAIIRYNMEHERRLAKLRARASTNGHHHHQEPGETATTFKKPDDLALPIVLFYLAAMTVFFLALNYFRA